MSGSTGPPPLTTTLQRGKRNRCEKEKVGEVQAVERERPKAELNDSRGRSATSREEGDIR